MRLAWFQTYGELQRFGTSIELPWVNFDNGPGRPSGNEFGDPKVAARGVIGRTESFDNALEVEFTLHSASNDAIAVRQTIFRGVWGFSRQITRKTLLSGIVLYNRGFHAQPGAPDINNLEPELILSQELIKRVAAFLDYDTAYVFNRDQFGQTLKIGAAILLTKKGNWTFAPYYKFPLNQFTHSLFKDAAGFELTFHY